MTSSIPTPPSIPFLGHVTTIDQDLPIRSFQLLAQQYGEIFQLNILGEKKYVINSQRLNNEISDEKRFFKTVVAGQKEVRRAVGDGLFTANVPEEQNWYTAHRLLSPVFSTATVHGMFDDMMDIVSQLCLKWERFGPRYVIEPAADFTRLTLDAICLCSMSYLYACIVIWFYGDEPHPFVKALGDFLKESGLRANRPSIVQAMMHSTNAKYEEDQRILNELVTEILEDRKAHPSEKKDILDTMLNGRDKETAVNLPHCWPRDDFRRATYLHTNHYAQANIRTLGMLTFIICYLLKNPEAMRKLRDEIDSTIGNRLMSVKNVNKLPYLLAVMRESLRLGPSVSIRTVKPLEDTVIAGGKYAVQKDVPIMVNVFMVHRDPEVWGDDAEQFRPERMLNGKFEALPPNSWQPFGFGMRACIGRPFAWQEVQIAIITILQKFDLILHDPSYSLELKQTLTIKPRNFYIHVIPRTGKTRLLATPSSTLLRSHDVAMPSVAFGDGAAKQNMYVLYGSNTGSSEAFAQRIASDAPAYGFRATIGTLDSAAEHVPTDGPVLIVTASFEGTSAASRALNTLLTTTQRAGGREIWRVWVREPRLGADIPAHSDPVRCAIRGARWERLVPRGEGDAGGGEFFESFDKWEARVWERLTKEYNTKVEAAPIACVDVQTVSSGTARAEVLRQAGTALGTVVENRVLTAPGAPVKRHIEFELPEGMTSRVGDYLAILPTNPPRDVKRAIARFGLSPEQEVTLSSVGPTSLPVRKPITLFTLLSGYVELSQPATTRDLDILSKACTSPTSSTALAALSASYSELVFKPRLSHVPPYAPRNAHPTVLDRVLATLGRAPCGSHRQRPRGPAISGRAEPFLGVGSTYLAELRPGDKVQLAVRASNAAFHPPADLAVPLVMFCAGAGLAPMRGFLQERAMQKKAGREVRMSLLFFGCRAPKEDYLYAGDDLKEWVELGWWIRVWHDRADIVQAFVGGCKFFVCGSGKVASGVKEALVRIIKEQKKVGDAEAEAVFDEITSGRFATDVFE
ncbi:hypothetical protein A0H81_14948 [Grifola frondosa]|uniref:FAD-binding FR-type domain-containing protein n=1 Tax=Grifola frondosa TaxID=5627 RepID=A0A1C7LKI3_GRIFR|nr:hypothetical protein A0H81_14948 [Grifola frondosa]